MWTAGMFKLARCKPTVNLGDGAGTIPIIYIDDVIEPKTTRTRLIRANWPCPNPNADAQRNI